MASLQQLILAVPNAAAQERIILQPVDNEKIGYLAKGATHAIQRDPNTTPPPVFQWEPMYPSALGRHTEER